MELIHALSPHPCCHHFSPTPLGQSTFRYIIPPPFTHWNQCPSPTCFNVGQVRLRLRPDWVPGTGARHLFWCLVWTWRFQMKLGTTSRGSTQQRHCAQHVLRTILNIGHQCRALSLNEPLKSLYLTLSPQRETQTNDGVDLLQVSLSLSYRSTIVYITWRSTVARRGGARKRDLSTSENLGSKLNRKCKTCFNCFPSISFCIIYYNGTHVIYTVLDQYI
jgi:hypothetical protein